MKTVGRERDRAEIVRRLRALRQDSPRRWGRMSSHQMVCHLSDACRMLSGQLAVKRVANRLPRPIVRWMALYLPVPWPTGILTTPELDQERGGTRPALFADDVAELVALLELIATHRAFLGGREHPVFGRLSEAAWLRWAYLHADHHLRQFGV